MDLKSVKLYPSKKKTILLFIVSLAFVATGIMMGMSGELMGFLCAGFFGIGVVVFVLQLIPESSCLIISKEGITTKALFRQSTIQWEDVDEFFVLKMKHSGITTTKMIGFNYSASYNRQQTARMVASAIAGSEGALPVYGMKAEELAALLNEWHAAMKSKQPE